MKLFIEKLKRLTANNQHTNARIEIAYRYSSYLGHELEIYKAIECLSTYTGKTSRENLQIRDEVDKSMMKLILHNHGRVIADMIEGAL